MVAVALAIILAVALAGVIAALDPAEGRPGASTVPPGLGPAVDTDGPGLDRRS